ncbi:hypothetical protein CASFOL_006274 [Castilleja foliolosa]|uniref:Uncharacterized protein n=1 Tax=Castilleja foliolosa TaxID=1961234 RepID=A0ABD3E9W8_9LAMI
MSVLVSSFVWRLPITIMKYGVNFFNLGSAVAPERSTRRRPLHTCGASLLAIAQKSCTKLQHLDGPLGSTATKAISFINFFVPFIYIFLYPFLATISYIDDRILAFETKAESIFPPSTFVFDKIDNLVSSSETLPDHIDHIFNHIYSILTHFKSRNASEKEIPIDVDRLSESSKSVDRLRFLRNNIRGLDEPHFVDSPMYASYQSANSSPVLDCSYGEAAPFTHPTNYSYKDMLMEKGQKEANEDEKAEMAGKNSNEGTTITDSNEKSKLSS